MTRRIVRASLVAFSLMIVMAAPVSAGADTVTITLTGVNGVETFTTDGGGGLCTWGTSENFSEKFGGSFASRAGSFHGYKELTCGDGSGSFRITYDAATVFGSPQDQGGWHFIDGTDAYEGVKGGGNLVGTYIPDGIIDVYTGRVTLP
jgi:hypothetical protein